MKLSLKEYVLMQLKKPKVLIPLIVLVAYLVSVLFMFVEYGEAGVTYYLVGTLVVIAAIVVIIFYEPPKSQKKQGDILARAERERAFHQEMGRLEANQYVESKRIHKQREIARSEEQLRRIRRAEHNFFMGETKKRKRK